MITVPVAGFQQQVVKGAWDTDTVMGLQVSTGA